MTNRDTPVGAPEDRARSLVASMRDACERLERLGAEHETMLDEARYEEFARSLAARGDDIATLERASVAVESILADPGSTLTDREIATIRERIAEVGERVSRVLERDAAHQARVEGERDKLATQLSGVQSSRTAMKAYGGGSRTPCPKLQDRQG